MRRVIRFVVDPPPPPPSIGERHDDDEVESVASEKMSNVPLCKAIGLSITGIADNPMAVKNVHALAQQRSHELHPHGATSFTPNGATCFTPCFFLAGAAVRKTV